MHAKRMMLAAASAVAVLAAPVHGHAQTVPAAPAAEKKPSATGVKSYEAGTKAFEAGKFAPAIQSLSNALNAGGLSSQQMAKALYYRGAAYRKTGKAAQAISDLTSAVWLKNGLSDADRAAAMEQRQAAYQEAGLGNATPIGTPPLDAPAATAAIPPAGPPAPAPASSASPPAAPAVATLPAGPATAAPADSATSSWSATNAKAAAEASVPSVPAGGYASLSSPDAPTLSALPQGDAAPAASPAPLAGVGTAISNAGSAVTGFFGNMFSGNATTATTEPSAAVATATAPQVATPPPATVQAPPVDADWSSGTSVSPGRETKPAKAPPKSAAVEKPRAANGSKYRLQVGIVRSREEAEGITATLRSEYAAAIGTASPAIDEVTFGNGTFYRVQVGPYASAAEPGQLCTTLKPKGFDCLVVTK
jgi:hypothetical protein